MLKFLTASKSTQRLSADLMVPQHSKAIITCETCDTDCRVPADRGTINVTCPGCGHKGLWSPPAPTTKAKPVTPGQSGYPELVRIAHACKKREGVSILTFKRFGFQGKGTYRLHQVETLPRGSGRAAIAEAVERCEAPEVFPHDLIDWSEVACPHCHVAVSQTVACWACRAVACLSGVSQRRDRQYLSCLCGAEGAIRIVDVVELTQTKIGHVRDEFRPAPPPSPSAVPRLTSGRQELLLPGRRS